MLKLLPSALMLALVVSLLMGGRQLKELVHSRSVAAELERPNASLESLIERSTRERDASAPRDPAVLRGLSKYLFRAASRSPDLEIRKQALCEVIANLEAALRVEPEDPMTLLAWLEVRMMLGQTLEGHVPQLSPQCEGLMRREVQPLRVLQYASERGVHNPSVQFQIGRLASQLALEEQARQAFQRFLRVSQSVSAEEQEFLSEWLQRAERISAVLPSELPQVRFWSERLRPAATESESIGAALEEKQRAAMEQRWRDVQEGRFPVELFLDELSVLSSRVTSDRVRQDVDTRMVQIVELYQTARNDLLPQKAADLLRVRAELDALPLVPGWNRYDAKPEGGLLMDWGMAEPIAIDTQYRSIGFMLSPGDSLSLLLLTSKAPLPEDLLSRIHLFLSHDNLTWTELPPSAMKRTLASIGEDYVISFELKERNNARLWKLHYGSKSNEARVRANLSDLVRAYGVNR